MKHLPGSYKVERKETKSGLNQKVKIVCSWVASDIKDNRRLIATINTLNPFWYHNALLLAAAPDLLEACKKSKARWEKIGIENLNQVGLEEYGVLSAAIAKAEGSQS